MTCPFCKGPFHSAEAPCDEMTKTFSKMEMLTLERRRHSLEVEEEWPPESYLVKRWTAFGFDCAVTRGEVSLCGYARVPEGHPYCGKHYDDIDVSVHGGITFCQRAKGGGMWFGFDTAHYDDWWGDARIGYEHTGRVWTVQDVVKETERMAEQFAACGERKNLGHGNP